MPFHANFDAPIYDDVRRCTSAPFRPKTVARLGRPDPRAGQRAARRAAAAGQLRPDPGLRRHRRGLDGVRIGRSASRSRGRRAGHRQRGQPGAAGQRRRGGQRPARLPGVPDARSSTAQARAAPTATRCRSSTASSATGCPTARRCPTWRPPSRCSGVFIGGTETVPKIVAHGLWELGRRPDQTGRGAGRPRRQRARRARGDDPLLRAGAVVRAHAAQTVHHSRHHDRARPADHHAARRRRPATSANTPSPTSSSGTGRSSGCWRSAAASTSASACTWRASRSRIMVTEWLKRVPDFRVDADAGVAAAVELPVGLEQRPRRSPVEV